MSDATFIVGDVFARERLGMFLDVIVSESEGLVLAGGALLRVELVDGSRVWRHGR